MDKEILRISHLAIEAREDSKPKTIVADLDLVVHEQKIVALVGGSGSGKTTTGLSILRLLPPALAIVRGEIIFDQKNIFNLSREEMRSVRGKDVSMVFQEPLNAFNPVFRIGEQMEEVLVYHTDLNRASRRKKVFELLELAGIAEPARVAGSFPHQLSGGLRQRAMIAQAMAAGPKLIIADEPTSNLDVTLQARIMDVFRQLSREARVSILLITHDLGMVSHLADEIAILYEGRVVEFGPTPKVLESPQHFFTRQLMEVFG